MTVLNFTDVTEAKAFDLKEIGMITAAVWQDIDGDEKSELIITGDWMAPKIFKTGKDGIAPYKTNLDRLTGAWSALATADVDGNGYPDLILGNRGTNSFYRASSGEPVKMYVNDFDNNGTIEQILTRPIDGRDIPVHLRREISGQIASVKKQNLKFSEYAKKSIQDLFSEEIIQNSIVRNISTFKSVIAYNNGDGTFKIEELPVEVQLSSIHAIEVITTDEGQQQIFLAGNNFNFKPQYTRLDANQGIILTRQPEGSFKVLKTSESGFNIKGQVRALKLLKNKTGDKYIIAGVNNEAPKLFKLN
ncbi:VCBS repeat-containing protein [Antarcticibacterium sp. 1MA-6-2]|uniref:FG-GAP and VCBS repeat-containing protein n=1 Tax=Antarcticibacterium sp. 1MA-6-2 TaxID=2908210 RepID=UPI001F240E75|nr:FG-GAP and VCBS repeat-containing protein [Antarcticibacterium sp. 1MA-6-2]UJH92006.1 VCBS repeat-containing protein [Antarcticibacterium sp. 1MA-6-2]